MKKLIKCKFLQNKQIKLKLNLSNLHEPSLKNFCLPLMPRLVNDT